MAKRGQLHGLYSFLEAFGNTGPRRSGEYGPVFVQRQGWQGSTAWEAVSNVKATCVGPKDCASKACTPCSATNARMTMTSGGQRLASHELYASPPAACTRHWVPMPCCAVQHIKVALSRIRVMLYPALPISACLSTACTLHYQSLHACPVGFVVNGWCAIIGARCVVLCGRG